MATIGVHSKGVITVEDRTILSILFEKTTCSAQTCIWSPTFSQWWWRWRWTNGTTRSPFVNTTNKFSEFGNIEILVAPNPSTGQHIYCPLYWCWLHQSISFSPHMQRNSAPRPVEVVVLCGPVLTVVWWKGPLIGIWRNFRMCILMCVRRKISKLALHYNRSWGGRKWGHAELALRLLNPVSE